MIKEPGWNEFFRFGLTFDRSFRTALLEEELNGAKILDYASGSISLADLNRYLKKAGRPALPKLPEFFLLFHTAGFFYDSNSAANAAAATDADSAASTDADSASASGCVIPLIPNSLSLAARSIDYLLSHALVYRDPDTAYLSEPLKDEIKLGGGGVLNLAITEYLICASRSLVLKFCVPGRLSQRLRMRKFCIQGTCSRSRKLCDAAIPKLPALSETEFSPC